MKKAIIIAALGVFALSGNAQKMYNFDGITMPKNKGMKFKKQGTSVVATAYEYASVLTHIDFKGEGPYETPKELCKEMMEGYAIETLSEGEVKNIESGTGWYMYGIDEEQNMGLTYACYLSPDKQQMYAISVMHEDTTGAKGLAVIKTCQVKN